MRKIFLICLAILLTVPFAADAKKNDGLPEEERIKVVVEIINTSRYKELNPAQSLELFLGDKLAEKNLVTVVDIKTYGDATQNLDEPFRDDNAAPNPAENIGELLVFDAVELPRPASVAKDFDPEAYRDSGATYLVRCEVLGIGATKVDDKTLSRITSIIGSGLSIGGNGNSNRDKTLRRVGSLIGLGGFIDLKRTALNTVVNMQFINAQTGEIIWQENFIGQAVKHHTPRKGYTNVWEQAYIESVEDSAKIIAKRVNKYVDRVIIKGKSDKSFMPDAFKFSGLGGGFNF